MARLMIHRELLRSLGRLPAAVQKKVADLVQKFHDDSTQAGIHLEPLDQVVDRKVRSARVGLDYRAIVIAPEQGDTFLLMHVDHHDEAYRWCRNKRFEVHERTGVLQVFDAEEVAAVASQQAEPVETDYPLARLNEEELFQAGVPRALLPAVKAIRSDDAFEALAEYLPKECTQVLYGIASGMTLDQALEETLGSSMAAAAAAPVVGAGDFSTIDQRPNFDLVLVEGEDQLRDILSASLDEWRVFLHPYQRRLVDWKTNGPMKIFGAAGTGKTVALMHRAVFLAKSLESPKDRILVTTYTTNLSVTIKDLIGRLSPTQAPKIEVTNLHALARTICARSGWRGRIAEEEDLKDTWDVVWEDASLGELPRPRDFFPEEYRLVIDPMGIDNEDAYLTAARSGRPRLGRKERKQAWPVFLAFQRHLKKKGLLTFEGAVHQARLAVEQGNFSRYSHVLVDEIQDFGLEALRLIRALSPVNGHRDPLCVVGDGHQRIYGGAIPLSRAGIEVRGRSRRLKINYRTSEQIRRWAQGILKGAEIDDLDGEAAAIVGDRSVFKGPPPRIQECEDDKEEARMVVDWVKELLNHAGLATHEICVTPYKKSVRSALDSAGIPTLELKARERDPGASEAGVRLGTMRRIKGLEFRAVAMACNGLAGVVGNPGADLRLRCEYYVAATRAREHLLITL